MSGPSEPFGVSTSRRAFRRVSSVVLRELVPPDTITLARPERKPPKRSPGQELVWREGTGENFRMFRVGPQSERGGMIAWAAVPLAPHAPLGFVDRGGSESGAGEHHVRDSAG
jgi:hypothetical protein